MPVNHARRPRAYEAGACLILGLLGVVPGTGLALVGGSSLRGEIRLSAAALPGIATAARQRALDMSADWRAFRGRHGDWRALWNDATGTPHRALGPAIPLDGFAGDSASVDLALRRFVVENPALFGGAPSIEPRSIRWHGSLWYASYRQRIGGLEVMFTDWEFRVAANGRLMMFGADAVVAPAAAPLRGTIAPAAARAAAIAGVDFDPVRDIVESAGPAALLPVVSMAGLRIRVVLPVRILTEQPPAHWLALVDAGSGEVVMRISRIRNITGHVTAFVHPTRPTDPMIQRPLSDQYVFAGEDSALTDTSGAYSLPTASPVLVRGEMRGSFAQISRLDLYPFGSNNARDSSLAAPGDVVDVAWGLDGFSHDAERDAFYHGNIAHAHVKSLEPGFTGLDQPLPIFVNYPYGHCNAFWTGFAIYLFSAGDGCVNTATAPDVLYHEYGHAVNDLVYAGDGIPDGMLNGSLQEGTADINAAFISDDPVIGEGFSGPDSYVRRIDEPLRWPEDQVTDSHATGGIIAGAFWDLRQAIGLPLTDRLEHQAKHGHPDDEHDVIAFMEMFLDVLVADDDDGDLSNATPHAAPIANAFGAHGIGPNAWIVIDHAPVDDPPAAGSIPVTATIRYTGVGVTALDPGSPTLHVAVDRGAFSAILMTPTGTADVYGASIPADAGSVVRYYITARDGFGDEAALPTAAPARRVFSFVAGAATPLVSWDMAADPGWTVGAPGDDATNGLWLRANPVGTSNTDTANFIVIQPGDDHTPSDTTCWVTGNADTMYVPWTNDVDNGHTTLTTAAFDAVAAGLTHPVIEYWRWYSNNTGSFTDDTFRADISNDDGATWVPLEAVTVTVNSWERVLARIEDYCVPTHTMRVRFVAADELNSSVVEAAVDDFRLLAFPAATVATERAAPLAFELLSPRPNPSAGAALLRYRLPAPARVRLAIYDVGGRLVRSLLDGASAAGEHELAWDGRDVQGRATVGGLYFVRLDIAGAWRVQRLVRIP